MSNHAPKEERTDQVTVECATVDSGDFDGEGEPILVYTLSAVEAWCADLRRWGARDDLVLDQAEGLTVTLNVARPVSRALRRLRLWAYRNFHCRFYVGTCPRCENWPAKNKRR